MDFSDPDDNTSDALSQKERENHWQPAMKPNDDMIPKSTDARTINVSRPQQSSSDSDSDSDDGNGGSLDPAWGIKRTDSAQILERVQRSTSFPSLSPGVASPNALSSPLESPKSSVHQQDPISDSLVNGMNTMNIQSAPVEPEEQVSEQLFGVVNPQSKERSDSLLAQDPEQERYDEGVPLIQPQAAAVAAAAAVESFAPSVPTVHQQDDFGTADGEDAGFFTQLNTTAEDKSSIPHLERKDTADVLGSMTFANRGPDSPQKPVSNDLANAFADDEADDMWKAALGDDEDEFLVEDADDLLPDSEPGSPDAFLASLQQEKSLPQVPPQMQPLRRQSSNNPYAPHQPSTDELTNFSTGRSSFSNVPHYNAQPKPANIVNRGESFVDQAKGGYKSPYDLPMDLAPKRKPQAQRVQQPTNIVPPPPRTSSMSSERQLQSPFSPSQPQFSQSQQPHNRFSAAPANRAVSASVPPQTTPAAASKRAASGFFEELPVTAKLRAVPPRAPSVQQPLAPPPRPTAAVMQQPQQMSLQAPQLPPQQLQQFAPQQPMPQSQPSDPYAQFQLRAPEKLDPYANVSLQPAQSAVPPPTASRYSPAPPAAQPGIRPSPSPRYSPAPPQAPVTHNRYVSQPPALPFQPRTSSPLAQHRKSVDEQAEIPGPRPGLTHTASSSLNMTTSLPPPQAAAPGLSPPRPIDPSKQPGFAPPQRSQTQSPSQQLAKASYAPRPNAGINRPSTAYGQLSPNRASSQPMVTSPPQYMSPVRAVVEEVEFIQPTDETMHDPLQRWKGAPIFHFGFGGKVVKSIPTRTPRYTAGSTRPQYKASPGEVTTKSFTETIALPAHVASFPGPLKGKSKKKDVLTWLASYIAVLESEQNAMLGPSQPLGDLQKRHDEKVILWKIVKIIVENDGTLETPQALEAVNLALMPEIHSLDDATATQYKGDESLNGIYRPAGANIRTDTADPMVVESLRKHLLKGKREDAVWLAVDNRLWSHAMLIASTLDKSVWRQVVQEFVKQEVKTIGNNAESLCALYEVFGGSMEESVDQLVPPSARAGLQMVSKVDATGPTRNALDGLNRWKETLSLVLNNRTMEDQRALATLARLLSDYGRVEAAHICFLFAKNPAFPQIFGGMDDPAAGIVLLGADHRHHPTEFHLDRDAIMLTEIYEFAVSALASGTTAAPMPQLAVYKLQHANDLSEAGMKTEAQAYCDFIASGLKSNTKYSLYYHPLLLGEVEDLSNRLKQVPMQGSGWMTKPSIEKVSGSVWNKFSQFVTGEDSDAESKASKDAAESGPFANVSGSPTISRSGSQTDLYGSYPIAPAATAAGSRYAPNGMSSRQSSRDMNQARSSFEAQRSPPSTSHSNEGRNLYAPAFHSQMNAYSPLGTSPSAQSFQTSPDPHMPSVAEEPMASPAFTSTPEIPQYTNGYEPAQPSYGGYNPTTANDDHSRPGSQPIVEDSSNAYAPPQQSSFAPPEQSSYGGYAPPESTGYVPYQPEDSDSESESKSKPKPKKKSFINDDDDSYTPVTAPAVRSSSTSTTASTNDPAAQARRKANDAAADAAFRAAAEADAAAADSKKRQSGWLGGWFGGAKKPESLDAGRPSSSSSQTSTKAHQVHLGESKMKLFYDKEKKKWVNPDNPEASEKKVIAPPPRSASAASMAGPPRSAPGISPLLGAGPPSRTGTPAGESDAASSRPGSSAGGPPQGIGAMLPPGTNQALGISGAPTPPPQRPASALSNASGLDDLLGGPPTGGRKVSGRGAKAKKGRYVDVMAK